MARDRITDYHDASGAHQRRVEPEADLYHVNDGTGSDLASIHSLDGFVRAGVEGFPLGFEGSESGLLKNRECARQGQVDTTSEGSVIAKGRRRVKDAK
jgi:hypothetical protein